MYLEIAIEERPIGRLLFEVCKKGKKEKQRTSPPSTVVSPAEGRETEIWLVDVSKDFHMLSAMNFTRVLIFSLLQLFSDACPRTCENFRALCIGGTKSRCDGRELTYKNSFFHRIVKNGWIQGGGAFPGVPSKSNYSTNLGVMNNGLHPQRQN